MILNAMKGFLTLFLLVKILLYFVPKHTFQKYVSFFSGVILVIGLFYPLLQLLGQEDMILKKMQDTQWEVELFELSEKAEKLEKEGMVFVEEHFKDTEAMVNESEEEEIVIETINIEPLQQAGDTDE